MWQGGLGCTDGLAVHRALLSGCKRVSKLIVSLREPKFSLCSCCFLLASISTTLARTKLTRLVLSLPKESHAEHHCCASDDASLGPQAWLCLVSKLHTARDSLTINLLHVDTADSFLLHGGSE